MMADIYRDGQSVYAWLGRSDADSDFALQYIAASPHQRDPSTEKRVAYYLTRALARPYFLRSWVVQECVLNQSLIIVCGEQFIKWESISDIRSRFTEDANAASFVSHDIYQVEQAAAKRGWTEINQIRKDWHGARPTRATIYDLAVRYWYSHCSDPVDKVYAFLSLAADALRIKVDYTQSMIIVLFQAVSADENDLLSTSWKTAQLVSNMDLADDQILADLVPSNADCFIEPFELADNKTIPAKLGILVPPKEAPIPGEMGPLEMRPPTVSLSRFHPLRFDHANSKFRLYLFNGEYPESIQQLVYHPPSHVMPTVTPSPKCGMLYT